MDKKITWYRQEVFREPDGFRVEYEEIDKVPLLHFTFLTKRITPSLLKMLAIINEEICDVLYQEGFDKVFSYTNKDNKSVIALAKKLGYNKIKTIENQEILVKNLKGIEEE